MAKLEIGRQPNTVEDFLILKKKISPEHTNLTLKVEQAKSDAGIDIHKEAMRLS